MNGLVALADIVQMLMMVFAVGSQDTSVSMADAKCVQNALNST